MIWGQCQRCGGAAIDQICSNCQAQEFADKITDEVMEDLITKLNTKRDLEESTAPRCFVCGFRCDPPFGDSVICGVCRSKPTGLDMETIVY